MSHKILVIYTGGTIGMIKSDEGVYVPFSIDNLISYVPQINNLGIDISINAFDEPLDSAFIGPNEWLKISNIVADNYDDYDGFVILHGTDTMAYTSSALSFLLRGLDKPVILTGSQIPICEEGTDGVDNFVNALKIAKEGLVNRVAVWFHKSLYSGATVTKIDSKSFDGFDSPNHEVLATLQTEIKYNKNAFGLNKPKPSFFKKLKSNVLFLQLIPTLNLDYILNEIDENYIGGIVFSVLGSGTVPFTSKNSFYTSLKTKSLPIIAISDCPKGGVEIGKYQAGSVLKELNVISGMKMTKEAAIAKLMVAISNFDSEEDMRSYLLKNQVDEF